MKDCLSSVACHFGLVGDLLCLCAVYEGCDVSEDAVLSKYTCLNVND